MNNHTPAGIFHIHIDCYTRPRVLQEHAWQVGNYMLLFIINQVFMQFGSEPFYALILDIRITLYLCIILVQYSNFIFNKLGWIPKKSYTQYRS